MTHLLRDTLYDSQSFLTLGISFSNVCKVLRTSFIGCKFNNWLFARLILHSNLLAFSHISIPRTGIYIQWLHKKISARHAGPLGLKAWNIFHTRGSHFPTSCLCRPCLPGQQEFGVIVFVERRTRNFSGRHRSCRERERNRRNTRRLFA